LPDTINHYPINYRLSASMLLIIEDLKNPLTLNTLLII